jgi:hypothetical protein
MQKDKKVKSGASNRAAKPNQWQFVGGWWWWLLVVVLYILVGRRQQVKRSITCLL